MIFAHVDCSRKNHATTHSYILRTYTGRKIKEVTYVSHETNSVKAELDSLVRLLNYISSKKINKVKIYTDCKPIVQSVNGEIETKFDVSYLRHMLKMTNSKLRWKSRERNSEADQSCKKLMKVVENRLNNT